MGGGMKARAEDDSGIDVNWDPVRDVRLVCRACRQPNDERPQADLRNRNVLPFLIGQTVSRCELPLGMPFQPPQNRFERLCPVKKIIEGRSGQTPSRHSFGTLRGRPLPLSSYTQSIAVAEKTSSNGTDYTHTYFLGLLVSEDFPVCVGTVSFTSGAALAGPSFTFRS